MGFFDFFDYDNVEHVVSFDLTIAQPTCSSPTRKVPSTSSSTPRIPLELVLLILSHTSSPSTYKACSLVCHSWSLPSQQLLFQHVTLSTLTACLSFTSAIDPSTPRGTVLGASVQTLTVSIDHNQPFGLTQFTFAHAFKRCPNLVELGLALYGCASPGKDIVGSPDVMRMRRPAPSFDDETLALLKAGPRIHKLKFSNWSENRQSVTQLLGAFPEITDLVMTGTAPELPSTSTLPPVCTLSSLRMNFQSSPSTDFLQWLLHNSAETRSLRGLAFDREPPAQVLEFLLNTHRETLESLSLPSFPATPIAQATKENPLVASLSLLESLQSFSVEDPASFTLAAKKLPKGVERLSFGVKKDMSQGVVEAIKSLDMLQSVNLMNWEYDGEKKEEGKMLSGLKMACCQKGVDLQVQNDVRRWRELGMH